MQLKMVSNDVRKYFICFPGQGSQYSKMGYDLYERIDYARDFFDNGFRIANELLKQNQDTVHSVVNQLIEENNLMEQKDNIMKKCLDLQYIMFTAPAAFLNHTIYSQMAIFLYSAILFEMLVSKLSAESSESKSSEADVFAKYFDGISGHSLGEYIALYGARALSFESTLRLLFQRGIAMSRVQNGAMMAILGYDRDCIEGILEDFTQCWIANDNCNGQIVVSGDAEEIGKIAKHCKKVKIKSVALKVSGPFHSPLMDTSQREVNQILATLDISDAAIDFYSSVNPSKATRSKNEIIKMLERQMISPVLWRDIMKQSVDNNSILCEVGPGNVLSNLAKRDKMECVLLNGIDALEAILLSDSDIEK